jgi:hypothetical protein
LAQDRLAAMIAQRDELTIAIDELQAELAASTPQIESLKRAAE